ANTVQGNYIGTNATGTAAIPNGYYGILVIHSDNVIGGTTGVTVGGPCSGACNLISGNTWDGIYIQDQISNEGIEADYNTIQGNFIGTDVTGTSAIPNGRSGILLYKDTKFNLIGGTDSGAGNLIAGNTRHGIEINGDIETRSNTIQGNRIGTNAAGTAKIPNGQNGFLLAADTTLNVIGGSDSGAGNLISGNTLAGISLNDARNNTIEGNQVGTNLAGTTALSNGGAGISLANGADTNQIGGADSGESNLISGNGGSGVVIDGSGTNANVLAGNFIGTDVAGMTAIANVSYGVQIKGGADLTVIENNLISGNGGTGVTIQSGISQDNSVTGNYIGTKVGGTAALPNAGHGVEVGGDSTLVDGNVISGNTGSGVFITSTRDVSIQGNMIGMAGDTVSPLGNGQHGIRITNSNSSLIGTLAPNRIGANGADGIYVESGSWNRVDGRNEFRSNGGLGIDLGPDGVTPNDSGDGDSGANGLQNFPVFTEVHAVAPNLVLKGTLNSAPNQTFTLHFYQSQICDPSGYGEGEVSIDADTDVTTDGSGNASFTAQAAWDTAMNDRFISVFAVDTSGNTSEFSTCEAITPFVATPANFTATVLSEIDIQLAWVDQSVDETEWIIERSLTGKNQWTELTRFETEDDTGTGAVVTYDDATFLCSRSYDYRLRAYNETGGFYSVYTPVQTAVPNCPALNPPDDFTAVASSPNQIDLAWTDTDINNTENGYRIDHSTDGGTTWKLLLIVPANTEAYAHTNLICNTGHSYRLRAVRSDDNAFSDYTPVQTATTLTCPALAAPLNPAANALSRSEIQFSWEDGSPGQTTRFDVERSSDGTTWASLTGVAPSTTRVIDTNLACGQAYSYRVRAFRVSDGSYSAYSSEVSTSTNACAAAVTHTVGLYQAGIWQFWQTNAGGSPAITFNFGPQQTGWQPVVGDWDGDGTDGIGVYQNGVWLLRNATSGGSVDVTIAFGPAESGWQPVVGDWDGDGTDGIGLYKNGLWLLRQTATSGSPTTTFAFGPAESGWLPVAGDWNGSGLATVGLYKDGLWLLSNRMPAVSDVPPFVYASVGWVPVVGDWNEDRQETAGAYQNGVWQLRQSNSGGMPDVSFAVSVGGGWQPLASVYEGGMGPLSILAVAPTTSAPATSTLTATPVATVEVTASVEPTELPTTATEPVEVTDEASPEATQEVVVPDTATPTPTPTETDLPTATPTEEPTATPVPAQSDSTEEPQS
ncbi:MAG: right-handed parallel beta-helix repeat-containing protein, partial [Anaerolineae bacterium]|nr:right-handed parallel beta-helix repeat-containing protein [Anaerolineae bacterium]